MLDCKDAILFNLRVRKFAECTPKMITLKLLVILIPEKLLNIKTNIISKQYNVVDWNWVNVKINMILCI